MLRVGCCGRLALQNQFLPVGAFRRRRARSPGLNKTSLAGLTRLYVAARAGQWCHGTSFCVLGKAASAFYTSWAVKK